MVAHRTSPTNMGLALLSNLSAHDFGYIVTGQLIERTENAFKTMESLEKYRGHFYNWYDTKSLKPLLPTYISSVDSGNLAGSLLTLRPGLLALADQKILGVRLFDGLGDTVRVLADTANGAAQAQLARLKLDMESAHKCPPDNFAAARLCLEQLATSAAEAVAAMDAQGRAGAGNDDQAAWWAGAFSAQCRATLDELEFLAPWILMPPDSFKSFPEIPTLRQLAALEDELPPGIDDELKGLIKEASRRARLRIAAIERLALQCGEFARMEYDFLFDKARHLLSIGYNVGERRLDESFYDLLASEARLCSFIGIAQGQLPQESWFALGRLLTPPAGTGPSLMERLDV